MRIINETIIIILTMLPRTTYLKTKKRTFLNIESKEKRRKLLTIIKNKKKYNNIFRTKCAFLYQTLN